MNKYNVSMAIRRFITKTRTPAVVVYPRQLCRFYEGRAEMLRRHRFSQQVLLAERVAFGCAR